MTRNPCAASGRGDSPEEGSALLVVILLTLIVTVLGSTLLFMSNADHLIAANEKDAERALHASKAGLEYGYYLFSQGLVTPSAAGASFDSLSTAVKASLGGGSFAGKIYDLSATIGRGQLYRIESSGAYNKGTRTTEIVVEVVPDSFKFGYMGFTQTNLHNHSGLSGPSFRIESTIFSNGNVSVPDEITIDGAIVSGGTVTIDTASTIKHDIFANAVVNKGTIEGRVKRLCAVQEIDASALAWNRLDNKGIKYNWYNGKSAPGTSSGTGTIVGGSTSYAILNGDEFRADIFRRDGRLQANPDLNVVKYIGPPKLDYQAMKKEADKYDPTYFTSMTAAMTYLAGKKVTETIGGKTLTTIKVGSDVFPEFLYVVGDFSLTLDPDAPSDSPSSGVLKADGFHLEGGIYASGDVALAGPTFDPAKHPTPPDWYEIKINALPYCLPAVVAYKQPGYDTIATWTPDDTPAIGSGSKFDMKGSGDEGYVLFHGATYSQDETHMHHADSATELIRFIGAELAETIHNCDFFWFTYDPAVRCTQFLVPSSGTAQVVSYREVR